MISWAVQIDYGLVCRCVHEFNELAKLPLYQNTSRWNCSDSFLRSTSGGAVRAELYGLLPGGTMGQRYIIRHEGGN